MDFSAPKDLATFSALTSTAPNATKEPSDQDSSSIPEEIQDLRILDCTECFDKDSQIQALNKSKDDFEREATIRNDKIKVLENAKKYFENTISSMESKIQDFKAEVASKNSKIKALELSKTHIEDANFSTNNHLLITNNDLKKVKQELQAKVDLKNSELQALWNTNVLANIEIEKIKKDLKSEIASKDSEIKALNELNESTRNELQRILQLIN